MQLLDRAKLKIKPIFFEGLNVKFQKDVLVSLKDTQEKRNLRLSAAKKIPDKINAYSISFRRNPDVVAEVLLRAGGYCEKCKNPAPFLRRSDNSPYLEVHHVTPLVEGGEDTVENAVALCPNCHREAHYA